MNRILLDGELYAGGEVSLAVSGRAFAFGFGVFETMKVRCARPCYFWEHAARLARACQAAGLHGAPEASVLWEWSLKLLEAESVQEGVYKIVVFDDLPGPRVAVFLKSRGLPEAGAPARLVASQVVKASGAFTSRYKSLNYMESTIALDRAHRAGFDECVFRNEAGAVTECAVANIFWLRDGVLNTPSLECGLLDGIVRAKLLEIAESEGISCQVGVFSEEDLMVAEELFLSSSGKGPRPAASYQSAGGRVRRYEALHGPRLRQLFIEQELESVRL